MTVGEPKLEELLRRITTRQDVFGGKPIVRDLRISVELIVSLLAQGSSVDQILDDYPALDREDIRACLAYAHAALRRNRSAVDRRGC